MKKKLTLILMIACFVALSLTGCGQEATPASDDNNTTGQETTSQEQDTAKKEKIRIGTVAINQGPTEAGVASLEAMGYEVEVVLFDDVIMPNTALMEDTLDVNYFQHEHFMEQFNSEKNGTLMMLEPKITCGKTAVYSSKHEKLEDLPDNAQVTFASDSANKDRSLKILEEMGLIKLAETPAVGAYYTIEDVVENPKNLELVEVPAPQVPATLADADMIVVYNPNMIHGGYDTSNPWFIEESPLTYAQGLVINKTHENEPWVQDVLKAYTSDETKAALEKINQGDFEIVFDMPQE